MAEPTWNSLAKSGVDSETIEEAIERIVEAHNDDDTAHMGAGQSIDEHRKETTLDHPVGSVLADKETITEFNYKTTFESISGFSTVGTVGNSSWPGVTLEVEDGNVELSRLAINLLGIISGSAFTKDFLIELEFNADTAGTTYELYAGFDSSAANVPNDFGVRVVGGQLRSFATINSTYTESGNLGAINGSVSRVRMQYIASEAKIYVYLDGVEVETMDVTTSLNRGNQFIIRADANGEESGVFRFYSFRVATN